MGLLGHGGIKMVASKCAVSKQIIGLSVLNGEYKPNTFLTLTRVINT